MDTSKRIKTRQYRPIKGIRQGNVWTFKSESGGDPHTTWRDSRNPRKYGCSCKATGLCEHITAAVLEDAATRYQRVSVWTSKIDAEKQRRHVLVLTANRKEFYVTYGIRKLTLDNPDVLAVALIGPWVTPQVELIFNWKTDRVVVPGTDLLNEAARRGWEGNGRGRIRPGVAA